MKESPHCPYEKADLPLALKNEAPLIFIRGKGGGGERGYHVNGPQTNAKIYWSILKTFLIDDKLLSDFKEKANRFNKFFSCQSTLLNNGSEFPSQPIFVTNERLSSDEDIIKIIRALNINKAHSHDDISIRMTKMCDYLCQYLTNITTGTFPYIWKKSNIPVHRKNDK